MYNTRFGQNKAQHVPSNFQQQVQQVLQAPSNCAASSPDNMLATFPLMPSRMPGFVYRPPACSYLQLPPVHNISKQPSRGAVNTQGISLCTGSSSPQSSTYSPQKSPKQNYYQLQLMSPGTFAHDVDTTLDGQFR